VLFFDTMALDGGATGRRYLGNFLDLIHKYGTQGTDGHTPTGGPGPAQISAELYALPGWPQVDVTFRATVQTTWGQSVWVTGDHTTLGDWTRAGQGEPLTTDGTTYPVWTAAPLSFALGTRLDYKLIKRNPGVVWESGDNRTLVVDPTAFHVVGGYPQPAITTDLQGRF
jgi:hypothetical protein